MKHMVVKTGESTTDEVEVQRAVQDSEGNVIANTYAKTSGSYPNMTVGNATHADSADSAAKATTTLNITIDLNTMQGAAYWGKRYYGGGSGVANRPNGVNGYALEIIQGDATSTVQVLYSVVGSESSENRPTHYQRSYSAGNSTWSEWEELVTAEGNYPNLTAGEAKGLSKVGTVYADSASRVGWHKFAEVPLSALTAVSGASSYSAIVLVNGLNPYQGGDTANSGIVEVDMRVDGSQFTSSTPPQIKLLSGNVDIQKLCFKRTDTEVGLYINTSSIYVRYSFTVLDERYYLGRSIDAMEFADEYYGAAAPDGAVYATNVNQAANVTKLYLHVLTIFASITPKIFVQFLSKSSTPITTVQGIVDALPAGYKSGNLICNGVHVQNANSYQIHEIKSLNGSTNHFTYIYTDQIGGIMTIDHDAINDVITDVVVAL